MPRDFSGHLSRRSHSIYCSDPVGTVLFRYRPFREVYSIFNLFIVFTVYSTFGGSRERRLQARNLLQRAKLSLRAHIRLHPLRYCSCVPPSLLVARNLHYPVPVGLMIGFGSTSRR